MELNALQYINTAILNVYQTDLKITSISSKNPQRPLDDLESFEFAFSDDWKDYEKAVIFTRQGFSVSVSERLWTNNTAKIPALMIEETAGKLSVKIVGFKDGIHFKQTNAVEIK